MGEKENLNVEEKGMSIDKKGGKRIGLFLLRGMKVFWQGCCHEIRIKIGLLSILLIGSFGLGWFLGFKLGAPVKAKFPPPRKPFKSLVQPYRLPPKVKLPLPPKMKFPQPVVTPRGIHRPIRPDVRSPHLELGKPVILGQPPQIEFPAPKLKSPRPIPEGKEEE
ncbi:MAG: hypothetical protein U9Q24_04550 [Candidatus Ratteibacteria bacterium]|nr:hypothetical protein [Candidatus Ratteibacteria bacterium]